MIDISLGNNTYSLCILLGALECNFSEGSESLYPIGAFWVLHVERFDFCMISLRGWMVASATISQEWTVRKLYILHYLFKSSHYLLVHNVILLFWHVLLIMCTRVCFSLGHDNFNYIARGRYLLPIFSI